MYILIGFCHIAYTSAKLSKLSHFLQLKVQDGQGEPQLHVVEPALKPPAGGDFTGIENEKFFLSGIEKLDIFFLRLIDMLYKKRFQVVEVRHRRRRWRVHCWDLWSPQVRFMKKKNTLT